MIMRRKKWLFCYVAFAVVPLCAWAQGNILLIVPPEAATGNDGNSSLAPFSTTMSGRFQQVYNASVFAAVVPPEGGIIREIRFRSDANGLPFDSQIGNLQINLSTTSRTVDSLSSVFGDNLGGNDQIVFGPAPYRIRGGSGEGFSTFIALPNPFYYNPAAGNLLVDFRILSGTGNLPAGGMFDAFNVGGDSVSSVLAFGSSLPSSGSASSLGLATVFLIAPVPEPTSYALLLMGVAVFHFWRKRKPDGRKSDVAH
jgi:hypothetical protein